MQNDNIGLGSLFIIVGITRVVHVVMLVVICFTRQNNVIGYLI